MIEARADIVGSLLRPRELLEARLLFSEGSITRGEYKAVEDRAVDAAIALQEQSGLEIVTDGEQRRLSFQSQLAESVDGFGRFDLDAFVWGEWRGHSGVGDKSLQRPPGLGVTEKLTRKRYPSMEEFAYLRARTRRTPKITIPSPSLWANFWSPKVSEGAYPTLDAFLSDVVDLLRSEVAGLARLGAEYIQLDAPHYTLLLDPRTKVYYESKGWTVDRWLARGIEMDNAVIGDNPGVTFGFHL